MTNYYHILGISENASLEEIKAAFKKQAVKYHPDKHPDKPGMEEKFKEVNQAYQVLSDQYEKARYDLKLKYRQFSHEQSSHAPYSYQRRPGAGRRPTYTPPRVDYKQNAIATFYAFAITFGIAIVVMIGVWLKEGYDRMKYEELLAERRAVYEQAKTAYDNEEYEVAFEQMSSLSSFRIEERDMKLFKDNMTSNIIEIGNNSFEKEDYDHAIYLYELVQQFEDQKPHFSLKTKLAEAYRITDRPRKSIEIYEELMVKEYRIISSMIEIAEIRRDLLKDVESARDSYLDAHKQAVRQYKNFYGDAYSLVIDQRYVPAEHYDLYTGLADIYLRLDNPDMAIKAADWNKYVWPDSSHAYVISAEAYITKQMQSSACEEYQGAQERGWTGTPMVNCN